MPQQGYFDVIFGSSGIKTPVPDTVQSDGSVSYTQGYGPDYQLAPGTSGAKYPEINDINQLFNDVTTALQQYQQNGIPPFITSAMNNGSPFSYAQYATVLYGGVAYQSNTANNTDTPPSSKWNVVSLSSSSQFTGSNITGTANAIVIGTTNPASGLSLSVANQTLVFTPTATNTGSTTVAVTPDGISATLVKKVSGMSLVNLTGGEFVNNVPAYISTSPANSCFVLQAGPALGTMAPLNIGNNLANDTNGNAVATVPPLSLSGTSETFQLSQWGSQIDRTNSGTAMTDTLPGTSGAMPSGWYIEVQNSDATASDTVAVGSGGSITYGNQTITSTGLIIEPGETYGIFSQGSGAYVVQRAATATLHAGVPQSIFVGLSGQWASNTTSSFSAKSVVVQDANGNTRRLTSWSATVNSASSGAGGLDTGSIASSTWYYIYAIFNPTTNTKSILMSASATSPTLPSGYTFVSGVLGAIFTDGSAHFLGFIQYGRQVQYVVGNNLSAVRQMASGSAGSLSSPTWASVAIGNYVPTAVAATIKGSLAAYTGGSGGNAMAAPNNSYGAWNASTNAPPVSAGGSQGAANVPFEFVIESSNIYWASNGSPNAIYCLGFTLNI